MGDGACKDPACAYRAEIQMGEWVPRERAEQAEARLAKATEEWGRELRRAEAALREIEQRSQRKERRARHADKREWAVIRDIARAALEYDEQGYPYHPPDESEIPE
jgi:hypothetical protein